MTVKLGTNPIAWSNDDLESLGGETPLETCLREARAAGFVGIEMGNKFPRDAATLGALLKDFDLSLVSGWYSSHLLTRDAEAEIEALAPHMALLKEMGCDQLIFAETSNAIHGRQEVPLSQSPSIGAAEMETFARRVTEVAEHVRAAGLQLAYHHHAGTVVETGVEIEAFMAAAGDAVGLLLDTGHAVLAGADPAAIARRYGPRITHVHCKDLRADVRDQVRAQNMSFLDAVIAGIFTVPGDGCIDFAAVLDALSEPRYQGWLVVEAEQDPKKANPGIYAAMGHQNLARFAAEAGLA
ncbi:myo-inosose-2 dehydratase [Pelagibius litoralis]|uniref:Myo-inosose-2 dehydratase n=1 Tax=Pelagibius litoralis TaxID=374515 RepID=A0A967C6T9_9PROT|nr:myo-inosose-2 dehydratase [Pelagibius litoralis]NIA67417.1 myo-inosose-2 dehydratase [Pelagibius litoralis]